MNSFINAQLIEAHEVVEAQRMTVLPRHFGRHMTSVEAAVYTHMRRLCPAYAGGYWRFLELSNGGFYLAPEADMTFQVRVDGNGFEGDMSADAAGITACLFALSHLTFRISDDCIAAHFHLLRAFALSHSEARSILAAID